MLGHRCPPGCTDPTLAARGHSSPQAGAGPAPAQGSREAVPWQRLCPCDSLFSVTRRVACLHRQPIAARYLCSPVLQATNRGSWPGDSPGSETLARPRSPKVRERAGPALIAHLISITASSHWRLALGVPCPPPPPPPLKTSTRDMHAFPLDGSIFKQMFLRV